MTDALAAARLARPAPEPPARAALAAGLAALAEAHRARIAGQERAALALIAAGDALLEIAGAPARPGRHHRQKPACLADAMRAIAIHEPPGLAGSARIEWWQDALAHHEPPLRPVTAINLRRAIQRYAPRAPRRSTP